MELNFNIDTNNRSNYSLSFSLNLGETNWIANGNQTRKGRLEEKELKGLPQNRLFNITSIAFNFETNANEVLSKHSCYYNPNEKAFCILIEEKAKCFEISKEIMLNLIDLAQRLKVDTIFFLIDRKNPRYVNLLQALMTIGFEQETVKKTAQIEGKVYKILKMNVNPVSEDIQEIEF